MVLEQLVKSKYGLWMIQLYQIKLTFLSFELFIVMGESVLVFGKCVMKGFRVKRQGSATHCPKVQEKYNGYIMWYITYKNMKTFFSATFFLRITCFISALLSDK